jgi:hypothetical protein
MGVGAVGPARAASAPGAASRHGAVGPQHRHQADQDDGVGAQRGALELLEVGGAVDVTTPRLCHVCFRRLSRRCGGSANRRE